jgi:hypothetical protein
VNRLGHWLEYRLEHWLEYWLAGARWLESRGAFRYIFLFST